MSLPPRHEVHSHRVERMLGMAATGIKMILTKASKKVGKFMLRNCRAELKNVGQVHRIDDLMARHNVTRYADPEHESSDETEEVVPCPDPPTIDDHYNYFRAYLNMGAYGLDPSYHPPDCQVTQLTPLVFEARYNYHATEPPVAPPPSAARYSFDMGESSNTVRKKRRAAHPNRVVPAPRYTPSKFN